MGSRRLDTGGQQLSLRGYSKTVGGLPGSSESAKREKVPGSSSRSIDRGQEGRQSPWTGDSRSPEAKEGPQPSTRKPDAGLPPHPSLLPGHRARSAHPSAFLERTTEDSRNSKGTGPWNITYFFIFVFFFSRPRHAVYLSSQTRNQTCAPCIRECGVLITGLPGKFETFLIDKCSFPWCLIEKGCMRKDSSM